MVKVREENYHLEDGRIDLEAWLQSVDDVHHYLDHQLIRNACILSQLSGVDSPTESGESCLQQGLAMAELLLDLEVDAETLAAAIIYDSVQYAGLTIEDVTEHLGPRVAKLVKGVERMNAISTMQNLKQSSQSIHQVDNIRKMLLAMVDDARVVLIKLAERLRVLRTIAHLPDEVRSNIAKESMEIYAPLANRLGIGAIKWEMEDLSFRYIDSEKYKEIAKGLKAKRLERDRLVDKIVETLNETLAERGLVDFSVYGRSKHIHSIYRKMHRKNIPLTEIYDATAVRVLVDKDDDCYVVLGVVHELWDQIPAEFDDYVTNPKPNGYRSLHTAVTGYGDRHFEVQIRTHQMHAEAEKGIAAHWKYKEGGGLQKESHERKIEWLREVLDWQRELSKNNIAINEDLESEFLDDRVYIFTPKGDVCDLPKGSTPLDFAYHIHSEVGHRCRGAKVNGRIVPLTHALNTGEQVEVLTGKELRPSRDWLNPNLNYLKSSRAKAKIHHWFKQLDYEKHRDMGTVMFDKEIKRLNVPTDKLDSVIGVLNFKRREDLMAAIGRGDVRLSQVINRLMPSKQQLDEKALVNKATSWAPRDEDDKGEIKIQGVGNLLTHIAKCCQPVPGNEIIGYITLGRGISIHRQDCSNILHATEEQQKRLLEVNWGEGTTQSYKVDILVEAYDRHGLLRDITQLLTAEKTDVYSLSTNINKSDSTASIALTVAVNGIDGLARLLDKFKQIPNVSDAKRQS